MGDLSWVASVLFSSVSSIVAWAGGISLSHVVSSDRRIACAEWYQSLLLVSVNYDPVLRIYSPRQSNAPVQEDRG